MISNSLFLFQEIYRINESFDGYQISVDQYRKLFSAIVIAGARRGGDRGRQFVEQSATLATLVHCS